MSALFVLPTAISNRWSRTELSAKIYSIVSIPCMLSYHLCVNAKTRLFHSPNASWQCMQNVTTAKSILFRPKRNKLCWHTHGLAISVNSKTALRKRLSFPMVIPSLFLTYNYQSVQFQTAQRASNILYPTAMLLSLSNSLRNEPFVMLWLNTMVICPSSPNRSTSAVQPSTRN